MIQTLSDAKRLVADMHNSILESLEQKDTEIRRQAIALLHDLYEEDNYIITDKFSDEIRFVSEQVYPDDLSGSGKRRHRIDRAMDFFWVYSEEDAVNIRKGWNITANIRRCEYYHTSQGYYVEQRGFFINWSVSRKRWININRSSNVCKFTPR